MRVTFLLPQYPTEPIGGFRVAYCYAEQLVTLGHDVTVLHPRRLRQTPSEAWSLGTIRSCLRRRRRWRAIRRDGPSWVDVDARVRMLYIPELTASHLPDGDVIVTTAWQTAEYARDYPSRCGRPVSLIQHFETWSGHEARVSATWRLPWPKVVIATWLARLATELGATNVTVIPNGLDHTDFDIHRAIAGRPRRVAMMYGAHPWKGTQTGLAALRRLSELVPEVEVVLFGSSRVPPGVPPGAVVHRGPTPSVLVEDIYNGSAVFLCPSDREGWGLPSIEAMACGCALVTTDNGGSEEFAVDGVTALVRPVGDAEALAQAVASLLRDEERRIAMAQAGRSIVQGFDWETSGRAFEQVLKSARAG